jgi:hypothetical protein
MDQVIIDGIDFAPDSGSLKKRLFIESGSEDEREFDLMLSEARSIARPKAIFRQCLVELAGPDLVAIDGVEFRSRVLRVNLEKASRVIVFAASSGMEIETWSEAYSSDPVVKYWTETIREAALVSASERFQKAIAENLGFGKTSTMSPGSLEDWPITQQKPLFSLLGDTEAAIGLSLTDSFLMLPRKSVSGILFPVEERFESCQMCPRERCPNRRLPYDPGLMERKFAKAPS